MENKKSRGQQFVEEKGHERLRILIKKRSIAKFNLKLTDEEIEQINDFTNFATYKELDNKIKSFNNKTVNENDTRNTREGLLKEVGKLGYEKIELTIPRYDAETGKDILSINVKDASINELEKFLTKVENKPPKGNEAEDTEEEIKKQHNILSKKTVDELRKLAGEHNIASHHIKGKKRLIEDLSKLGIKYK